MMRVEIWPNKTAVGWRAARIVRQQLARYPNSVFAMPTGMTPLEMYRFLVKWHGAGKLDASHARFFNLDEFVGLPRGAPGTYFRYMQERFWGPLALRPDQFDIPRGWADDLEAECRRYDAAIQRCGGLDLALVGLGANGHIGFNEPGTDPRVGTHVVELSPSSRKAQLPWFQGREDRVPNRALTMGIASILSAERVLMLVWGRGKARAVAKALLGAIDPAVPASLLRTHSHFTVLLDREAAAWYLRLRGRMYGGRVLGPHIACRPD